MRSCPVIVSTLSPMVGVINERKTNHANHANHDPLLGRFVIWNLFQITVPNAVSVIRIWT